MSSVNLIFVKQNAVLDTITLDVSLSETHASKVEVTEHPVETGASIVDHARPKPDVLTIEGLVSADPLPTGEFASSQGDASDTQHGERLFERPGQAYRDLLDLKNAGKLVDVSTALRQYENMLLTDLSVPRDPKTGQALRFSATFTEVRVVSNREVAVEAEPKQHGGKKHGAEAPAKLKSTALSDVGDFFGWKHSGEGVAH